MAWRTSSSTVSHSSKSCLGTRIGGRSSPRRCASAANGGSSSGDAGSGVLTRTVSPVSREQLINISRRRTSAAASIGHGSTRVPSVRISLLESALPLPAARGRSHHAPVGTTVSSHFIPAATSPAGMRAYWSRSVSMSAQKSSRLNGLGSCIIKYMYENEYCMSVELRSRCDDVSANSLGNLPRVGSPRPKTDADAVRITTCAHGCDPIHGQWCVRVRTLPEARA